VCFIWISEQTAIISQYNINWLVFIIEVKSVYCAVRTGSLNIFHANLVKCLKHIFGYAVLLGICNSCACQQSVTCYNHNVQWHNIIFWIPLLLWAWDRNVRQWEYGVGCWPSGCIKTARTEGYHKSLIVVSPD